MAIKMARASFNMPMDIIFDILSILPVKTLVRFKLVCKAWYDLVENSNFIETQNKRQRSLELNPAYSNILVTSNGPRNTRKCRLLHFSETSPKPVDRKLPYISNMESCVMVGICNGLICVSLSLDSSKLSICNPTTGYSRQISPFKIPKEKHDLVFLGFHLHVNGYELIRIVHSRHLYDVIIRAELYTTRTDTWREIDLKLGKHPLGYILDDPGNCKEVVVIDGAFYWKTQCMDRPFVAFFNLEKKVLDVIDFPREWLYNVRISSQLHSFKDKLAMIFFHKVNHVFDLFVLNEHMDWKIICRKHLYPIPTYAINLNWRVEVRVIGSTRNSELILVTQYGNHLKLVLYDTASEK